MIFVAPDPLCYQASLECIGMNVSIPRTLAKRVPPLGPLQLKHEASDADGELPLLPCLLDMIVKDSPGSFWNYSDVLFCSSKF